MKRIDKINEYLKNHYPSATRTEFREKSLHLTGMRAQLKEMKELRNLIEEIPVSIYGITPKVTLSQMKQDQYDNPALMLVVNRITVVFDIRATPGVQQEIKRSLESRKPEHIVKTTLKTLDEKIREIQDWIEFLEEDL